MQLPQDVDIVPILGAHPWRNILTAGNPRDANRVSYVFAYDYRNKGEPSKRTYARCQTVFLFDVGITG